MRLMEAALGPKRRRMDAKSPQNVPEQIIHDILLWLPSQSLLKCTCVCKSWRSLIQSSAFIHAHLNRQNDGVPLLLVRSSKEYRRRDVKSWHLDDSPSSSCSDYSLHLDNSPSFSKYSDLKNPYLAYIGQIKNIPTAAAAATAYDSVIGTCNGLVCLKHDDFTTLIWNPSIRKFVILPPPSISVPKRKNAYHQIDTMYGFGYDSRSNDYKIFRLLTSNYNGRKVSCEAEIWSLARASWKSLIPPYLSPGEFIRHDHVDEDTFVNGALHWIQTAALKGVIVSFDISTESFGKIGMPEEVRGIPTHISRYGEFLAFFEENRSPFWKRKFSCDLCMWVMKEYGVTESWTKAFTINLQQQYLHRNLAVTNSGEVVLVLKDVHQKNLYRSVDPKTQKLNEFRIDGDGCCLYRFMDYFVESLVLLDQPSASSY